MPSKNALSFVVRSDFAVVVMSDSVGNAAKRGGIIETVGIRLRVKSYHTLCHFFFLDH